MEAKFDLIGDLALKAYSSIINIEDTDQTGALAEDDNLNVQIGIHTGCIYILNLLNDF